MDKKKYIRELSDADMPVSLTSQWNDRMALYNHLAPMIEDEIVTMLTSMPKPYAKLASTVKVTPNPVGLTISMDEYGKFVDSGTRPRVMMGGVGKTVPVGDGKFARVTPRQIAAGKWIHPGTAGKHFVDEAIERVVLVAEGDTIR
jgi:hypothetical protein